MATALLRRFLCPQCGATGSLAPRSPFLRCDSCRTISDYDFGVARRNPDWPRFQALYADLRRRCEDELRVAHVRSDRARWTAAYQALTAQLIAQCPAVYPAGIADPAYLARYLAWDTSHAADLVFDPELIEGQRRITRAVREVRADGGHYLAATLWPILPICLAHFEAQDRIAGERGPAWPDDFYRAYFRRVGASMTAQEWLTRLDEPDQHELVRRLGLEHEFVSPEAGVTQSYCGSCGHAMELQAGARRAFCTACGRELAVARGVFDCGACGVQVNVPLGTERAVCPFCRSDMREARAGLAAMARTTGALAQMDSELALSEKQVGDWVCALEVLDGEVVRAGKPWRMVTLRACYRLGHREDIYEDTNLPDAPGLADTIAWAEVRAAERGVPLLRRSYREHPRCVELPADAAELDRRLAEVTGGSGTPVAVLPRGPSGVACEVELGGAVVRLVCDDDGKRADLCRGWASGALRLS